MPSSDLSKDFYPFSDENTLVWDTEKAFDVQFGASNNKNVFCPFHEDPQESRTRSCSVSRDGLFSCKACGASGDAPAFYAQVHKCDRTEAERALSLAEQLKSTEGKEEANGPKGSTYIITARSRGAYKGRECTIPLSIPGACHADLYKRSGQKYYTYLRKERGLSDSILKEFLIGVDEYRITIPVFDRDGSLRNIRRYLPDQFNATDSPKIVSHAKGNGSPTLYPYRVLQDISKWNTLPNNPLTSRHLILGEGEWDTLLDLTEGFGAITNTGNAGTWQSQWTRDIVQAAPSEISIIFDVKDRNRTNPEMDNYGQRMAIQRAEEFLAYDSSLPVRVVELPLDIQGGDQTDWFITTKHSALELAKLIESTALFHTRKTFVHIPKEQTSANGALITPLDQLRTMQSIHPQPKASLISLHDAAQAQYYYKSIRMRCLVAGHRVSPYLVPKRVHAEIQGEDGKVVEKGKEFTPWDGIILSMLQCSHAQQMRLLRAALGIPKTSSAKVEILETMTVEEVFLIPAISADAPMGPYTLRRCFFIGHGLKTNQVYDFLGYTAPFPQTQEVTHVLVQATPAQTDIDGFTLSKEDIQQLAETFQGAPHAKMQDIATQLADHVTHIYGRADLHNAVDLVFHSPLSFDFDGTRVHKGWLECLILGDTRTGKGYTGTGIIEHYGLGEIISGENLTLAGLVASVQHVGDKWTLVWGKLPLNDRRLVLLDEASALSHADIGRLSRIRSEGIAEVTKVVSEKTSSRTRLIWLANPRAGSDGTLRRISDFNFGIDAAIDLIGAAEDFARFDFVLIVAQSEVPSGSINAHHPTTTTLTYTRDLCQKLVTWIWSRTPDQIIFEPDTVEETLRASRALGKQFTPSVCLIQAEDIRFKIARLAAAVAARTFSSPDGINLVVTKEHVQYAYNFIHHLYNKPCCGYAQRSIQEAHNATLKNPAELMAVLKNIGKTALPDLVEGLLQHRNLTIRDMCDYAGIDRYQAEELISHLVRLRAITKEYSYYIKRPSFTDFLTKIHRQLLETQQSSSTRIGTSTDDDA